MSTGFTKFKEEYCEQLIKWMSEGKSYITWGAHSNPRHSKSALYNWEKQFPKWKEAKEVGYALGLEYFERLLRSCALGVLPDDLKELNSKGINITAIIFTLKTRFHKEYGEIAKHDHISSDKSFNHNMSKAEKLEMINKYKEKLVRGEDEDTVPSE